MTPEHMALGARYFDDGVGDLHDLLHVGDGNRVLLRSHIEAHQMKLVFAAHLRWLDAVLVPSDVSPAACWSRCMRAMWANSWSISFWKFSTITIAWPPTSLMMPESRSAVDRAT